MTFADDTLDVAQSLGRLLASRTRDVDRDGLDVALVARSATLELAGTLHRDVVGLRDTRRGGSIADLEANPVLVLGRWLSRQRSIESRSSPTDALGRANIGDAATWAALARSAITARHEWPIGRGGGLQADRAWRVIADSASLVEAVAVLDGDLAAAAERLGEGSLAASLASSHTSGLRSVAGAVRALARSGALDDGPIDIPDRPQPRVLVVSDVDSAVSAQRNLATLLNGAAHVRPEHAVQIAIGHARIVRAITSGLLSGAMKREADGRLAERVSAVIEPLARAASRPGRVTSVHTGDPRPLQQASELARFVTMRTAQVASGRPDQLTSWVAGLARSVQSLATRAQRELDCRRWLLPDTRDDAPTVWGPHRPGIEVPVLLSAAREAAEIANGLFPDAEPCREGYTSQLSMTVHGLLIPALDGRQVGRPQWPGRVSVRPPRR